MSYPEHDKLRLVAKDSQKIGNFIEWLEEHGAEICHRGAGDRFDYGIKTDDGQCITGITGILALYFDIDQKKLEEEKRAMLDEMRASHG